MFEIDPMQQNYKHELAVQSIEKSELVVLRDVTRLPVESGDFISPNAVVIIGTAGTAHLLYDMQAVTFNPWDIAVVLPNHMVAPIEISEDYKAILLVISPELHKEMCHRTLTHDHIKYHTNPQYSFKKEHVQNLMKIVDVIEMVTSAEVEQLPHRHELITYMFDVFFETMSMYLNEDAAHTEIRMNKNEMLFSSFCDLLAKHHREHKTMTWYAEQLHLTPKYFSAQVQRTVGMTASDWIQEWILTRAKQLLKTRGDLNIQEISQSLGFEEQASFTRFFRRGTGMSPRQWREQGTPVQVVREWD